jgi:hypothetical protein
VSFDFEGEVSNDTLNHIADCIKKGFTQGEIIEELEVEEVKWNDRRASKGRV